MKTGSATFTEAKMTRMQKLEANSFKNGTHSCFYYSNGDRYTGDWNKNLRQGRFWISYMGSRKWSSLLCC